MAQKALTTIRDLLGQIIAKSEDPEVDALAWKAMAEAKDEDARTSSEKPSMKRRKRG